MKAYSFALANVACVVLSSEVHEQIVFIIIKFLTKLTELVALQLLLTHSMQMLIQLLIRIKLLFT